MTCFTLSRTALLSTILTLSVSTVSAQSILVTTGEHADFTRLVLQSPQTITWQLQPPREGTATRALTISGAEATIDLSRAFQRIPRARLADLVRTPDGLELHLNCDCPVRAWSERSGLVVLDIGDPESADETALPVVATGGATPLLRFTQSDLARSAGVALARSWPADTGPPGITGPAASQGPAPSPISDSERQAIMLQLTGQVAGALTQGILDPSNEHPMPPEMIRLGDGTGDIAVPPNLRIMSVLDRPDDDSALLPDDQPNTCSAAAALDFAIAPAPTSFNTALAMGLSNWLGEFDQPQQIATEELVILYLQHGFGAEARALLENAVHPIAGRDLLIGFADTLEGRQSNSRLRLAEQHVCGGAAAMLAALAGAPLPRTKERASEIASIYAQAPGVLRIGLGGALIRILLEAEAIDAGRVVADTLRRTPHARNVDLQMADALLDRARGETQQASARLSYDSGDDIGSVILRLQIALENGTVVPDTVLINAEAIAGTHRSTSEGVDLMEAIIRLRVNAGTPVEALALLDRLQDWNDGSTQGSALMAELGDIVWFALALQASAPSFLDAILNRSDWRNPSYSVETRTALAERLLEFGLTEAAEMLLATPQEQAERHLLARLHLERDEPHLALAVIADDQSDAAVNLRAQALQARGDSRASSGALGAPVPDPGEAAIDTTEIDPANAPGAAVSPADAPEVRIDRPIATETATPDPQVARVASPQSAPDETVSASPSAPSTAVEPAPGGAPPETLAEWATVSNPAPVLNAMERSAELLTESAELRTAFSSLLSDPDALRD